jgi:outer membrane protein assembly factor BamB
MGQELSSQQSSYRQIKKISQNRPVTGWKFSSDENVAVSDNYLSFYENGSFREVPLANDVVRTVFSKNVHFYATVSLNPRDGKLRQEKELSVTAFNSDAKTLYSIKRPFYYDRSLPSVTVSGADGSLILGENDTGQLWFYDNQGELQNHLILFPESSYDLEKTLQVAVAEDGSNVAVLASKRASSPAGAPVSNSDSEPHLFLFNRRGREIWRQALAEQSSSALAISPDGKYIAVGNFTIAVNGQLSKKTLIYDWQGQLIGSVELLFKHAAFSPDSRFLLLAENRKISFVDLSQGKELWNTQIPSGGRMVAAAAVSSDGKRTALLVAENHWEERNFRYVYPDIQVFDQSGKLIQTLNPENQSFIQPALYMSADGREISAGFKSSLQIFKEK